MTRAATRKSPSVASFTRREAASLAGVSLSAVDKAIEQGILASRTGRGPRHSVLSGNDVAVLAILGRAPLRLPISAKRQIREWVRAMEPDSRAGAEFALSPVVVVRYDEEAAQRASAAERYARLRDEHIEVNPEIQAGEPVIRGTRTTVSSIAARLEAGESIDDLVDDYPHIPREAMDAALVYARTHPRRGRPPRPWRDAA